MFKSIILTISILLGQAEWDILLIDANNLADVVNSSDSRKDLKKIRKAYEKALAEYQILRRDQAERFVDALQNKEVESKELRSLLNQFKREQITGLSAFLNLRTQMQAIPDSSEWKEYVDSEYKQVKFPKQPEIRSGLKETDEIKSLENSLNRVFSESKYEAQAKNSFERYLQTLAEITENEADRRMSLENILTRKTASPKELQKVLEDQFLFEKALGDAIIFLRNDILEIAGPADWSSLAPELSKQVYE